VRELAERAVDLDLERTKLAFELLAAEATIEGLRLDLADG
jgi:hypothetical protein